MVGSMCAFASEGIDINGVRYVLFCHAAAFSNRLSEQVPSRDNLQPETNKNPKGSQERNQRVEKSYQL